MATTNEDKRSRQQRAEQMRKARERADAKRRNLLTLGIVAIVVVLIAVATFAIKSQVDKNNAPAVVPKNVTKDGGIIYDQSDAGGTTSPNASPVSVVLYEDFQCPACRAFEASSGEFLQQQVKSGAIEIEYRPISFLDRQSSTKYSTRSLNAAACVASQKGSAAFYTFHQSLYANQPPEGGEGLPDSQLADLAKQAGATGAGSCIDEGTYEKWATSTTEAAAAAKVNATPTVLVDGKVVEGSLQSLQAAIAAAAK